MKEILDDVLLLQVFNLSAALESVNLLFRNGAGNLRRGAVGLILVSNDLNNVGMNALAIGQLQIFD